MDFELTIVVFNPMPKPLTYRPLLSSIGTTWLNHRDAMAYFQHMAAYLYTHEIQNSLLIGALEAAQKHAVRHRLLFRAVTLVQESNVRGRTPAILGSCAQFENNPALVVGFDDVRCDFLVLQQTLLAQLSAASDARGVFSLRDSQTTTSSFLVPSHMLVRGCQRVGTAEMKSTELWVKDAKGPLMSLSSTVAVRLAVASDAPLLWEGFCENQATPERPSGSNALLQAHFRAWLKQSLSEEQLYVLCLKSNPKVGVSMASFGRPTKSTATIAYVYTLPKYRGHQYAAQLTDHLVELASKLGKYWVLVWVDENNSAAGQLYYKIGFQNKYRFQYI